MRSRCLRILILVFCAFTVHGQIAPSGDSLPAKLREARARVDAQRYNVVPQPTRDGSRLDRLQRDHPGSRDVQADARLNVPLIVQGVGIPWIPGAGNQLPPRKAIGPDDLAAIATSFTAQYADLLGISAGDLVVNRKTTVHYGKNNRYWSLRLHQVVRGADSTSIPVREAHVFFRVNNGNLIQFGNYLAVPPRELSFDGIISRSEAVQRALALTEDLRHVDVADAAVDLGQSDRSLEVVLVNESSGALGHQLVRAFNVTGEDYAVELWLDAHTGEVVNVIDRLESIDGTVRGGIYPTTNNPATEDLRALPFVNVTNGGMTKTANASGVYDYSGGLATTSLSGPYVVIDDSCGDSSLSTSLPPAT